MPDFNKGVPQSGTPFPFSPTPNYTHGPPQTILDILNPQPYGPVYSPPQKPAPPRNPPKRSQSTSTKAKPSLIDQVVKAQNTTRKAEEKYGKGSPQAKQERKNLAVLMIQAGLMEPPKGNASSPTYDPFADYKGLPSKASQIKKSPPRTVPSDIQSMQDVFGLEMTRDILRGQGRLWQLEGRDATPAEYSIMSTNRLRQIGREWDELPEREKALRDPMHPKHDEYVVASIARELEQKHRTVFATSPEKAWQMVERGTYKMFGGVALSALSNPSLEAGMTQQQKEEFRVAFGKAAFLATTMSLNAPTSIDDIVLAALGKSAEGLLPRVRQALLTYLKKQQVTLRDPLDSVSGTWTLNAVNSQATDRQSLSERLFNQQFANQANFHPTRSGKGEQELLKSLEREYKYFKTLKKGPYEASVDLITSTSSNVTDQARLNFLTRQSEVGLGKETLAYFDHSTGEINLFRAVDAFLIDPRELPRKLSHELAHLFQHFVDQNDFDLLWQQYQTERRRMGTVGRRSIKYHNFEEWWADTAMRYEDLTRIYPRMAKQASPELLRQLRLFKLKLLQELDKYYRFYRREGMTDHARLIYDQIKSGSKQYIGPSAPGVRFRRSSDKIIDLPITRP